jgi:hypothetical protein
MVTVINYSSNRYLLNHRMVLSSACFIFYLNLTGLSVLKVRN